MASPNSIGYSIVKDTTPGTIVNTPVFRRFPHVLGNNLDLTSENIQSPIIMPNGAAGQTVKDGYRVEGNLKTHFARDDGGAGEFLLESALAGTFQNGVLKAGISPVSFTAEKTFVEGGVSVKRYFKGCQVAKFSLTAATNAIAEATYDIIGMGTSTDAVTAATYQQAAKTKRLSGLDVRNITVAGLTADYLSIEVNVDSDREAQNALGTPFAIGVGTSGARKAMISLTLYRRSYNLEALFNNNNDTFAVSFDVGSGANGYNVKLPAATVETPKDGEDGSKITATLNFNASYSPDDDTDVIITKLS